VFADATRLAPCDWLRHLVRPIAEHGAEISVGCHAVDTANGSIVAVARAATVQTFLILASARVFAQPWGGATAIRRETFARVGIADIWRRTIVDDVSIVPALARAGVRVVSATTARLQSDADGGLNAWIAWLTRQILYERLCVPWAWVTLGVGLTALDAALAAAGVCCVRAAIAGAPGVADLAGALLLATAAVTIAAIRRLQPNPPSGWRWAVAACAALIVTLSCFLRTVPTRTLSWRGIRYRVGRGGRVLEVYEEGTA
jgi:ceramide glucosyltransferase